MVKYEFKHRVELPATFGNYLTYSEKRKQLDFNNFTIDDSTRLLSFSDGVSVFISINDDDVLISSTHEFNVIMPSDPTGHITIEFITQETK